MAVGTSIQSLRRTLPLGVFGMLALVYLLTANGRIGLVDSSQMLEVTRALLEGRVSLPLDSMGPEGADGQRYSHFGLLTSAYWIPFVLAARLVHVLAPALPSAMLEEFVVSFSNIPVVLAMLAYLVWEWRSRNADEKSIRQGLWLVGLTTLVWPYTKIVTSDLMFAFIVLGAWCHGRRSGDWRHAIACGAFLGLALLCRKQAQTVIPVIGLYALLSSPRAGLRKTILSIVAGALLPLLVHLAYNHARWGNPFVEVYPITEAQTPEGPLGWLFMIGYNLFGSYQGFFLFNPALLVLTVLAGHAWWRHERLEVVHLVVLLGGQLLLFAYFGTVLGPISFGPRLLVFMIPLIALAWPYWRADAAAWKNWTLAAFAAVGLGIQALGVTTDALAAWQRRELSGSTDSILPVHATELQRVLAGNSAGPDGKPAPHPMHPAFQRPDFWWLHAGYYLEQRGK